MPTGRRHSSPTTCGDTYSNYDPTTGRLTSKTDGSNNVLVSYLYNADGTRHTAMRTVSGAPITETRKERAG
jgi:hypothetical protein